MASSITAKRPLGSFGDAPPGYDPNLARQLAPDVADSVRRSGYDYNRDMTARFQAAAGNQPDGLYGPYTVSTLLFYGVSDPPGHLFKVGDEIPPYHPPLDVNITAPGPGEPTTVVEGGGGVVQAGFDVGSALLVLSTAVTIGAGSIRGRFFSHAVPLGGHKRKGR